jgi:hypothetical protein
LASSRAGGGDAAWGHAEAIRGCQRCRGRRPWGRFGAPVATLPHGIGMGKAKKKNRGGADEQDPPVSRSGGVVGGKQAAKPKGQVGCD